MDTELRERETRGIFDSVFVCHGNHLTSRWSERRPALCPRAE